MSRYIRTIACLFTLLLTTVGNAQFTKQGQANQQQNQNLQRQQMTPQQQQALRQLQLQQQQQRQAQRQMPRPFAELSQAHVDYLDKLLNFWESNSSSIKQYQAEFTRFDYDQAFLKEKDPKTGHVYARLLGKGVIKYSNPDKAMYEMSKVWKFAGKPAKPGEQPKYELLDDTFKEKWVCDGKSMYSYLYQKKEVQEHKLPPEMQGERITNGPLPFLFGAKAKEIKQRYWLRYITPPNVKDEYWIEAYPKNPAEAAEMLKTEIVLAKEDFLPKAITVYDSNHNPAKGMVRKRTLEFQNRKTKLGAISQFLGQLKPNVPLNWKKTVVSERTAANAQGQQRQQQPRR